ncbi:hypothetical protein PSCICJ_45170 [Pseudomonas cichorii]|nr:hypothetical protein PSCICJ_45170 [Pseudomonas cichorii]
MQIVYVWAEPNPGLSIYISRFIVAASGVWFIARPLADVTFCNPNEFDREGTPPWLLPKTN